VDKIDPQEIARSAAAIAVMTYVIADMPERLRGNGSGLRAHGSGLAGSRLKPNPRP
jgi:hypothetical protein